MTDYLRQGWRWLFPKLQRLIPANYGQPLLGKLDRAASVFHQLYENGNYDPASNGEAWLLQRLAELSPQIFFDVGANRGEYSRLALKASSQARVFAFKPIPPVFEELRSVLALEPRAELHQLALADQPGELTFWLDSQNTGNTTAVDGVQDSIHGVKSPQKVNAHAQRLDLFCAEKMIEKIDLLKIDVEGFESRVLQGGGKLLQDGSISCIQIEYGKANLFSRYFIHDYMRDYGENYVVGKLFPKGVQWFAQYSADLDDLLGPSLIMVLRNRSDLIKLLSHPGTAIAA
jgi:FkbM family methyltransferase